MKLYISADIEGIAGITHWHEADKSRADYAEFRAEMTAEVLAACRGAEAAGVNEIWIKDAHGSGRNILTEQLPASSRIVRGWSGHPLDMVQQLDESFDAVMMIGYHARAGSDANPLAHTLTLDVRHILINDEPMSEFRLHANVAALLGVPVVFVSGDAGICEEVTATNPNIGCAEITQGYGPSSVSIAPCEARLLIEAGAKRAMVSELQSCLIPVADQFKVEIHYNKATSAYPASFYPGAGQSGAHTISFETDDYFEVMRLIKFTT
ncbi:MAG: amino acid amidase [Thiotrichales bacterium]|nr:amino acid amidase [Thiotrichales bacterium]|tara:strand:- start:166 stop:963 length:798 start_codon:yes stop_codon:yes gene_type:complete